MSSVLQSCIKEEVRSSYAFDGEHRILKYFDANAATNLIHKDCITIDHTNVDQNTLFWI